ncbi:MAG: ATP-grasp domain-containing protein [Lachnospiraceae bacterium]|nr:ATP-grasp domain-containing protein [Lachnospiraceae bacterium]
MTEKRKILMLGGSAQQVPAIQAAKDMGYYTVLIDYLPDNPGQYVADKWYQESTTDVEAVYRIAIDEKVSGILPYASDPAALPAAIVAERLGLPTNPAKSVEILGVKHRFRKFLQENGFPCPKNFTFSPDEDIEALKKRIERLDFPIVIKPTDSSGSKGVSFLKDPSSLEQAIKHADNYSRNKVLIAEEFIERGFPAVIGGDIFVKDGKIVLYGDMACLRDNNGKSLIPIGKQKPSGLSPEQTVTVHNELQRMIDTLEIKNGELNIEIILDKKDRPHFLELGPRAGGNMIPIQLSDAFGVDLIKANVAAAMGEDIDFNPMEPKACFMTYVLHSHKDGVYDDVEYSDEISPYIYRKVHYKQEGDDVEAFDGAGKALGIVFMKFPDEATMNDIEKKIDRHINIRLYE